MDNLKENKKDNINFLNTTDLAEQCSCSIPTSHDDNLRTNGQKWLGMLINNNNSLPVKEYKTMTQTNRTHNVPADASNAKQKLNCNRCELLEITGNSKHGFGLTCAGVVEDKGGGIDCETILLEKQHNHLHANNLTTDTPVSAVPSLSTDGIVENNTSVGNDVVGFEVGAASLIPGGHSQSNRTSLNNSTENLSYSSDNFYPEDLILLDDDDVEAEEISLNSDDCVYAYRGDGAEFDLNIKTNGGRDGDAVAIDDETDFLEMDFEPDPLSELEYGSIESAHADAFLVQRDLCILSDTHSDSKNLPSAPKQCQIFSSPIDEPSSKGLQSKSLLGKNFARITLHLDQIRGENCNMENFKGLQNTRQSSKNAMNDSTEMMGSTAHSLPNTLHTTFCRDEVDNPEIKASPSKTTGAKPKRLSTFSTSSSTSSKNSTKSRSSVRSSFALAVSNSSSFDERSVSCTEFRAVTADDCIPNTPSKCDNYNINDETCLDCLEKEFLANTIGKQIDVNECARCHKRAGSLFFTNAEQSRCRNDSPLYLADIQQDGIFETNTNFLNAHKRPNWSTSAKNSISDETIKDKATNTTGIVANQKRSVCENDGTENMIKNLLLTERETATIPVVNLNEESLVQALDKLQVDYNAELLKSYFNHNSSFTIGTQNGRTYFKNLQHFLLYESKKNCNPPKLKRLITCATQQQVDVQFKKTTNMPMQMTPVKVSDILLQWTRTKNLEPIKCLDKRFIDANILGKIGNIIRQAQQRCVSRRPLPEFILIPQYYENGHFTLTKKC